MACPCKYYDDYYDDGAYDDHANDDGDDQVTFSCPARAYELCLSPAPQFTICHAHHNLAHSKQLYHCCSTRTHWHWSSCTPQAGRSRCFCCSSCTSSLQHRHNQPSCQQRQRHHEHEYEPMQYALSKKINLYHWYWCPPLRLLDRHPLASFPANFAMYSGDHQPIELSYFGQESNGLIWTYLKFGNKVGETSASKRLWEGSLWAGYLSLRLRQALAGGLGSAEAATQRIQKWIRVAF